MYLSHVTILATILLVLCSANQVDGYFAQCEECDASKCPELHYCEGEPIKDHCGCCTICSSSKFQPHVIIPQETEGKACNQVTCPRMKVCVENMQRLPLCTCPSTYVCRRAKRREVCGTDGKTYPSRCHMKVASCNDGTVVRKKYRGPCLEDDEPLPEVVVVDAPSKVHKPKKTVNGKKKQQVDLTDADLEKERRRKKRKEMRRRRRRKIGMKSSKGRARRHRMKAQAAAGSTFDETFPQYTWKA